MEHQRWCIAGKLSVPEIIRIARTNRKLCRDNQLADENCDEVNSKIILTMEILWSRSNLEKFRTSGRPEQKRSNSTTTRSTRKLVGRLSTLHVESGSTHFYYTTKIFIWETSVNNATRGSQDFFKFFTIAPVKITAVWFQLIEKK